MQKKVKTYDNIIFAQRFRTLMSNKNIGLEKISEITGCAVSTASTWRRGRLPRDKKIISKIANYLGVTIDYLLGDEEDKRFIFSNQAEVASDISKSKNEIFNHINSLINNTGNDLEKLNKLKNEIKDKIPL